MYHACDSIMTYHISQGINLLIALTDGHFAQSEGLVDEAVGETKSTKQTATEIHINSVGL